MPQLTARQRARRCLEGLSLGDSFGQRLMSTPGPLAGLATREPPPPPWRWTDDTQMALAVLDCLETHGRIEPQRLALGFARRFDEERGYGAGAVHWVRAVRGGVPWFEAAQALFGGRGSYGNGGAMRAAPVGVWFAGEHAEVARQARASAAVTHAHVEGQAGAEAVALAASLVSSADPVEGEALLDAVARLLEEPSATRDGLRRARALGAVTPVEAARVLGAGQRVSSQDTVPFALWCAAFHLRDFPSAMWAAAGSLEVDPRCDLDTLCAIAGGVVAAASTELPATWLSRREPLPDT